MLLTSTIKYSFSIDWINVVRALVNMSSTCDANLALLYIWLEIHLPRLLYAWTQDSRNAFEIKASRTNSKKILHFCPLEAHCVCVYLDISLVFGLNLTEKKTTFEIYVWIFIPEFPDSSNFLNQLRTYLSVVSVFTCWFISIQKNFVSVYVK